MVPATEHPERGALVLIGGNESKDQHLEVLERFVELAGGANARIGVVPAASSIPGELLDTYTRVFQQIGVHQVLALDPRRRQDCSSAELVSAASSCTGVFFTGGNQTKLVRRLRDTPLLDAIVSAHDRGAAIAGTSAGASAATDPMVGGGNPALALRRGSVVFRRGFGWLEGVIVDQHFVRRGRIGRLFQALARFPDRIGIGLAEDTAVEVWHDRWMRVIGSAHVLVVCRSPGSRDNHEAVADDEPFWMSSMEVQVLARGCGFDLVERRFLTPEEAARAVPSPAADR